MRSSERKMVPAWTSASGQCANPRSWGHGVPERALLHVGGEGRPGLPDVQNHSQNPQDIRGDKEAGQNSHRTEESSKTSKRK